jgi:hypothetical protein
MRATRAYIASAGTAVVMLGASFAMLFVVSAFVAFGSWPGENSGRQLDQVLLQEVARTHAQPVKVRADAVTVARRADTRQKVALARTRQGKSGGGGSTVERTAGGTAPTRSGDGQTTAGAPVAAAPGAGPVSTVRQQTEGLTQNLDTTTRDVTDQVQQQVQDVGTQVNDVVDQVVTGVQETTDTTVQQVQGTVGNTTTGVTNTLTGTTDAVKNTAGGLLGH